MVLEKEAVRRRRRMRRWWAITKSSLRIDSHVSQLNFSWSKVAREYWGFCRIAMVLLGLLSGVLKVFTLLIGCLVFTNDVLHVYLSKTLCVLHSLL